MNTEILAIVCLVVPLMLLLILGGAVAWLFGRNRDLKVSLASAQSQLSTFRTELERLKSDTRVAALEEWLAQIATAGYRNEVEVEAKFIYPMVQFLGYYGRDIQLRVPVSFRAGRTSITGEADCVLWRHGSVRPPSVVIEAKAESQPIGDEVQEQARSYAFGLGAKYYILTNGRQVRLFELNIDRDPCLLDCRVEQLAECWDRLATFVSAEDAIGY